MGLSDKVRNESGIAEIEDVFGQIEETQDLRDASKLLKAPPELSMPVAGLVAFDPYEGQERVSRVVASRHLVRASVAVRAAARPMRVLGLFIKNLIDAKELRAETIDFASIRRGLGQTVEFLVEVLDDGFGLWQHGFVDRHEQGVVIAFLNRLHVETHESSLKDLSMDFLTPFEDFRSLSSTSRLQASVAPAGVMTRRLAIEAASY